ncbi:MAG: 50S ribosomal protein L24 [Parcubacteria group bacterium RIFOXYD2_FULL_52_8]|nr:ribosomal protein L24 [uncultured bacterium]OHB25019.1 MAG: 50S ribosomal protein L24 [Parcubacteria group bacterium RIFOXYD2_FULL_52_8]
MNIKKGQTVLVVTGKDKGKQAKVLRVFPAIDKVIVEGINMAKHHERARRSGQKGQILSKAMPMHVSNVMLLDPKSGTRTRVGMKMVGEKKIKIARKSGAEL